MCLFFRNCWGLILSSIVIMLLAGCNGDAFSGPECPPADTATSITDFGIVGNVAPQSNLPVVEKDGQVFSLNWDVETSCKYTFSVSLSQDDKFDKDDDIEIFNGSCAFNLSCREFADFDCAFSESSGGALEMSCGNSSSVEVDPVLDQLSPIQQSPYMFLMVTNEAKTISAQTSTEVVFDY